MLIRVNRDTMGVTVPAQVIRVLEKHMEVHNQYPRHEVNGARGVRENLDAEVIQQFINKSKANY